MSNLRVGHSVIINVDVENDDFEDIISQVSVWSEGENNAMAAYDSMEEILEDEDSREATRDMASRVIAYADNNKLRPDEVAIQKVDPK